MEMEMEMESQMGEMDTSPVFENRSHATVATMLDRRCAASQRQRPSDPATMRRTRGVSLLFSFSGGR